MARVSFPKRFTNSPAAPPHDPTITYKVWAEDILPTLDAIQDAAAGINTEQIELGGSVYIDPAGVIKRSQLVFGTGQNTSHEIVFFTGDALDPILRWDHSTNRIRYRPRGGTKFRSLGGGGEGKILYVGAEEEYQSIQDAIDALEGQPGIVYVMPGTYEISSPILLKGDGQRIIGVSMFHSGTTQAVYVTATAPMSAMVKAARADGSDFQPGDRRFKCEIAGIKFNGKNLVSQAIIDLTRCSYTHVHDCWLVGDDTINYPSVPDVDGIRCSAAGSGFLVREDAHYNKIESCYIGLLKRGIVIKDGSNSNIIIGNRIQASDVCIQVTESNNQSIISNVCEFYPGANKGNYSTTGVYLRTFAVGCLVHGNRFEFPTLAGSTYVGKAVILGRGNSADIPDWNGQSPNPDLFPSSDSNLSGNYYSVGSGGDYVEWQQSSGQKVGAVRHTVFEPHLIRNVISTPALHVGTSAPLSMNDKRMVFSLSQTAMSSEATYGLFSDITLLNTSAVGPKNGVAVGAWFNIAVHSSSNQQYSHDIYGLSVNTTLNAAVSYGSVYSARTVFSGNAGQVNLAVGLMVLVLNGAASSLTTAKGIAITLTNTGGSINTLYGLHINDLGSVSATTKYAIASDGGDSYHHGAVLIGAIGAPEPCALVELRSTTKGFLVPRLARANVANPVNGLIVYDTNEHKFYGYANGAWVALH